MANALIVQMEDNKGHGENWGQLFPFLFQISEKRLMKK